MNDRPPKDSIERFRELAWPMLPSVLRVARILTGNHTDADDLAQEAMMRAYRSIETYRDGTNIRAWLLTILRRVHIDRYRYDERRITTDSLDAMEHEPSDSSQSLAVDTAADAAWADPDSLLDRFDDDTIEHALRELPDDMRWTLLLLDVEQMSVAEVAAALDVAEGTVKSRASRARARLRDTLSDEAARRGWIDSGRRVADERA